MTFLTRCFLGIQSQMRVMYDLLVTYFFMMRGAWYISGVGQPIVTIFGGAKLQQDHEYATHAKQMTQLLIAQDISVITGGGPGIMEAANCAAYKKNNHTKSVGISVTGLVQEKRNACADIMLVVPHLFARKWLMTRYSKAFVVFPGGFGTADELFEILTLMQINKLQRFPIIVIGVAYWNPLLQWVNKAVQEGLIASFDADLLYMTDDIQNASEKIITYCKK